MIACQAGCTLRNRHRDDCPDPEACEGCLSRPALDGLRVCSGCERKSVDALRALPSLWVDVEASMVLRGRRYGTIGRTSMPLPIDVDSTSWRDRSRACLVGWCLVLKEDFDLTLDGATDTMSWMAERVRTHAQRILAHPEHADQLVADLCGWVEDDGTRHAGLVAEGRRIEGKGGSQPVRLLCHCGERVAVVNDADGKPDEEATLTCRGCGAWGVLSWWRTQLGTGDLPAMSIRDLVAWLAQQGHRTSEKAVRVMADRRVIVPVVADPVGVGVVGRPPRRFDPIVVLETLARRSAPVARMGG